MPVPAPTAETGKPPAPAAKKHEHRLDFLTINPYTFNKVGFELSPWSTHGQLTGTKGLSQAKINEMAKDNFEAEMEKHRSYFKKYDIFCLIYTDRNLKNTSAVACLRGGWLPR